MAEAVAQRYSKHELSGSGILVCQRIVDRRSQSLPTLPHSICSRSRDIDFDRLSGLHGTFDDQFAANNLRRCYDWIIQYTVNIRQIVQGSTHRSNINCQAKIARERVVDVGAVVARVPFESQAAKTAIGNGVSVYRVAHRTNPNAERSILNRHETRNIRTDVVPANYVARDSHETSIVDGNSGTGNIATAIALNRSRNNVAMSSGCAAYLIEIGLNMDAVVSVAYRFATRSICANQITINLRVVCTTIDPKPSVVISRDDVVTNDTLRWGSGGSHAAETGGVTDIDSRQSVAAIQASGDVRSNPISFDRCAGCRTSNNTDPTLVVT